MLIPVLDVTPIVPSFPQESHSVHSPLLLGGVEPPTKFSKMGASQDLNFEKGFAGKEGTAFFRVGRKGGRGEEGINFLKKR